MRGNSGASTLGGVPVIAAVALCLLAGSPLVPLSGSAAAVYALVASTVMACVGAVTCSVAAGRTAGRTRRGWALLAVACLGWGLGNAYWTWNELIAHEEVLFPSPADVGFLVFPPAGAAGLWLVSGRSSFGSRLTSLFDGLIVTGALFVVSWVTTLRSVYEAGADTVLAFAVSLAYPLGDLVLMTMAFLLAARTRRGGRTVVVLLITGLLGMAVADTMFAVNTTNGSYTSGSVSDAGWITGFAAFALAGGVTVRQPMALDAVGFMRRWQVVLPYVPFSAAAGISAVQVLQGRATDPVQTVGLLTVFALVLARQLITLMHNSSLTEQLRHQAFHDPLTGLANRALFNDRLGHALQVGQRGTGSLAMMYLDLDDFKLVNDTLGHDAGDTLLRGVAERLQGCFRPADTIARLGGDEFIVLVEQCDDPSGQARRMLDSLRPPFIVGSRTVRITASVGVATAAAETGVTLSAEDLHKHVDLAMYAAKAQGKNKFAVFEPPMRENFDEEMGMRADLIRALDEDALHVIYQPIVDLTDGRLAGVEALARWQHSSIGDVPPAMFIPIAERAGLIDGIGSFVLNRACAEFARWSRSSAAYLSVNVSPLQLLDPDFPQQVHDNLVRHGIRPDQLLLELTENALADESAMIQALHRLRCTGVRIAIDDFGTGYSSLRYLYRLPIDAVKIDRSYVQAVTYDESAARLIGTLAQLFSGLGLTIIAEGIEEPDQARTLLGLGCQYGQGYLFSRPVAVDRLPAAGRERVPAPSFRPA